MTRRLAKLFAVIVLLRSAAGSSEYTTVTVISEHTAVGSGNEYTMVTVTSDYNAVADSNEYTTDTVSSEYTDVAGDDEYYTTITISSEYTITVGSEYTGVPDSSSDYTDVAGSNEYADVAGSSEHESYNTDYASSSTASSSYRLADYYNPTNFWDKWWFFESKPGTGNPNDVDPTGGFVLYQNRSEAERLGLVQNWQSDMYIGVETATSLDPNGGLGRKSVRLESLTRYNHGLFIADFTYLPRPRCGIWPAFWMYGPRWPLSGEVDIIEQWNDYPFNRQTLHTANAGVVGSCRIQQGGFTNTMETADCAVDASGQGKNQGCSTDDYTSPYGSGYGGVYATEWTGTSWKMWSWSRFNIPEDVRLGVPNPEMWGTPSFMSAAGECNVDNAFRDQRLVLNIDFCGVTAGKQDEWDKSCRQSTGYDTCEGWVAAHPEAFTDVYWRIRSIDVYIRDGV